MTRIPENVKGHVTIDGKRLRAFNDREYYDAPKTGSLCNRSKHTILFERVDIAPEVLTRVGGDTALAIKEIVKAINTLVPGDGRDRVFVVMDKQDPSGKPSLGMLYADEFKHPGRIKEGGKVEINV